MIRGLLVAFNGRRHRRCRQPALSLGHPAARRKAAGAAASILKAMAEILASAEQK